MVTDLTPMMRQYLDIKEDNKGSILFFRLGDFYEMFFDDAVEASQALHITLTSRGTHNGSKVPMCGIPYHAADNYISRLVKSGKKVAICEQVEAPSQGKQLVKREIVKIITPGTYISDSMLGEAVSNYILSIITDGTKFGLAYADISTGEFRVTELSGLEELFSELYKISPSECLVPETFSKDPIFKEFSDALFGSVTLIEDRFYDHEMSVKEIKRHFAVESLEGFGCHDMVLAVRSAGALLKYLKNTQKTSMNNVDTISTYNSSNLMIMDRTSHRHLELVQNQEDLSSRGTLFEVLDRAKTPMGRRMLKRWILNPILDTDHINKRLDAVQFFHENTSCRKKTREYLSCIYDVERLSNKISLGTGNARDIVALAVSLRNVKGLKASLAGEAGGMIREIADDLDDFDDVIEWIESCLVPEPPHNLREGALVRKGYDPDLDELKDIVSNGKDWIAELQRKEAVRTGISSLKVGYNKIFGYYIEITNANLGSVPADYMRKQTLANAERFITPSLKEYESKVVGADERAKNMEYEIFCSLREKVGKEIERLKNTGERLAELDVLADLAEVAVENRYNRPRFNSENILDIKEGRHPVLEKILKDKEFVPNDTLIDHNENRIFIITGSNMAGKSTFIRQVALISIMAQMGSFVPARTADIGITDRIFTRVGASDRLYRGMSTFMVEMLETANILNNATERSLIILDEVGRGTSTFDGVSIAWAVVEYIHHKLRGARALFATHYHELTELADIMPGIRNFHLAVQEWGDEIIFLYKVKEGSCDDSFGIHVARLAGMPSAVVKRAREILGNLQKDSLLGNIRSRFTEEDPKKEKQYDLFKGEIPDHPVLNMIRALDTDRMTPLEALEKLSALIKMTQDEKPKGS